MTRGSNIALCFLIITSPRQIVVSRCSLVLLIADLPDRSVLLSIGERPLPANGLKDFKVLVRTWPLIVILGFLVSLASDKVLALAVQVFHIEHPRVVFRLPADRDGDAPMILAWSVYISFEY